MSEGHITQVDTVFDQYDWIKIPELAAFRCGRLANQIEHQTTVLWLHGREENANPSLGLAAYMNSQIPWLHLKRASRGVIPVEQQRMVFEQTIDTAEVGWISQFGKLWHSELCLEENEEIENEEIENERRRFEHEEEQTSLREIIADRCRRILSSVDEINRSLFDFFVTSLAPHLLEFFRLGQHVDRLLHPVPAYAELLHIQTQRNPYDSATPETESVTGIQQSWGSFLDVERIDSGLGDQDERLAGRRPPIMPRETPWRLPRQPLPYCLPSDEWWDEFACRAVSRGLSFPHLRNDLACFNASGEHVHIALHKLISHIEDGLNACFPRTPLPPARHSPKTEVPPAEGKPVVPDADPWVETPVGLDINQQAREIRISGSTTPVSIESPTTFNILAFLARKGTRYTTKVNLESNWKSFSGRDAPPTSRSGVNNQITKVKRVLEPLSFDIQRDGRGHGNLRWRIVPPNDRGLSE